MKRRIVLALCLTGLLSSPAFAQTGQINGVVTDNTGAIVPGVTVKAQEVATGLSRDTVSGVDGRYTFTSLRPTTPLGVSLDNPVATSCALTVTPGTTAPVVRDDAVDLSGLCECGTARQPGEAKCEDDPSFHTIPPGPSGRLSRNKTVYTD